MSEYSEHRGQVKDPASGYWNVDPAPRDRASAWLGWIWFAGIMMIMMGSFNAIEGLVALFDPDYYVVGPNNVLVFDLTGWGWIHLIGGVLITVTGIALCAGIAWARWVTVILAGLNAIAQLAFVAVYPVWSVIVIALCVLVIWAIVVHGEESRLDL